MHACKLGLLTPKPIIPLLFLGIGLDPARMCMVLCKVMQAHCITPNYCLNPNLIIWEPMHDPPNGCKHLSCTLGGTTGDEGTKYWPMGQSPTPNVHDSI